MIRNKLFNTFYVSFQLGHYLPEGSGEFCRHWRCWRSLVHV